MELAEIPLILPAAGKSSRLGSPKGLQTHARRTWLEIQCQSYAKVGGRVVALVLGYDRDLYLDALGCTHDRLADALPYGGCSLYVLHNLSPEFGPFSSLQQACHWIKSATDYQAAFFLPIDTPLPSATVLRELAAAMKSGINVVLPRFGNRGGHPVLLSRAFLAEISVINALSADARLDVEIRKEQNSGSVVSIAVTDSRVVLNLNDSEAWERYFAELDASLLTTSSAGRL